MRLQCTSARFLRLFRIIINNTNEFLTMQDATLLLLVVLVAKQRQRTKTQKAQKRDILLEDNS